MNNNDDDALTAILLRNEFYRRQYLLAILAYAMTLVVIIVLALMLNYIIRNPTEPLYFATDNVGRLVQETPLSEPNMSPEETIKWVSHAVEKAYSYDYINYRKQLQGAQKYFSNYGWSNYMKSLTLSNNLLALIGRKQIIVSKVIGIPKVVMSGKLQGALAWKFQLPLLVSYWEPPYEEVYYTNTWSVDVTVQRQPALQSTDGLGITQMIASITSSVPAANNSASG